MGTISIEKKHGGYSFHGVYINWLVAWSMFFIFHHVWVVILPIDELRFFRGVETTNQLYMVGTSNKSVPEMTIAWEDELMILSCAWQELIGWYSSALTCCQEISYSTDYIIMSHG